MYNITTHAMHETGAKVFICESCMFHNSLYSLMDLAQRTTSISSTGTVLYNVHSAIYGTNTTTTTTVTAIGEIGDTVLAGLIHYPPNLYRWAIVTVSSKQLQIVPLNSRDDVMCLHHNLSLESHIYISLG